ncbi:MAG: hypothetical protein HRU20_16905 [Pseudomonadales bacterium]|nr:hypothetical protein [Pseudomonadales bacterium]
MAEAAITASTDADNGWLRNRTFDTIFVPGIVLLALISGLVVIIRPDWFKWVLFADLWLLGYHHVIATYTRLAFDANSLRQYRFIVFVLPVIVFGATFILAWSVGIWVIATVYLYWQWFHYTRQSWGISRVYQAKSGGLVNDSKISSMLCFYLLPVWGILHRSWQAPSEFLFVELRVVAVPEMLVNIVGVCAILSLVYWAVQRFIAWQAGRLPVAHTCYMLSHFTIFSAGYLLIEDITQGWLIINIWHNAQYILFVWIFNGNRYKKGIDANATFLSTISQPKNFLRYMLCCVSISSMVYLGIIVLTNNQLFVGVPLAILIYQTINFHHYIVDSLIWKVRKKPMQETLDLDRA